MSWTLLLPAATGLVLVLGLSAGRLQRRLQPSLATTTFTMLAAIAALAVVAVVAVVSLLFISSFPPIAERLPWCRALADDHDLPTWWGGSAVAAALAMTGSLTVALRRAHAHRSIADGQSFVVLPTDEPAAFAVPGDPGCVVVSAGMLRALDGDERRVLLAHERAHLARQHHRYLWVTAMATAMVPVLRPLEARVRFATERWADEDAARAVGDRRLVARALCRAALAQDAYPGPAMSLAGLGVHARVDALLAEPPARTRLGRVGLLGATAMTVLAASLASSLQLHHLATLAAHLCPGA